MHICSVTKVRPALASDQTAKLETLDVVSYELTNISQLTNIVTNIYSLIHSIAKG